MSFSPTRKLTFAKATAGKQGEAGGIPPEPPFRPPRPEAEAKRQTAKEPEKMSARTLFWPEAGFSLRDSNKS